MGQRAPSIPGADHWAHRALHWLQTAEGREAAHVLDLPHLLMPEEARGGRSPGDRATGCCASRPGAGIELMLSVRAVYNLNC